MPAPVFKYNKAFLKVYGVNPVISESKNGISNRASKKSGFV